MIRPQKQTGYILLPVIVVITLVAAIALLMNTESALESHTAGSELDAQQAQYVAAAGLNHALWLTQQQGCGPYNDLTDEPLGSGTYSSKLTTDLGGTAAFTIGVDQDGWIRDDLPTNNYAADTAMHIRSEGGVTERPLLRFDLSPLPSKASILSATAWFYVSNDHPAGPADIHLITADWNEADATWDSMGANIGPEVLASIPPQPAAGVWVSVNLTSQVQAWINGAPNYGITLGTPSPGVHGDYASRESVNAPWLEVIVGTPPTKNAKLRADGELGNGVKRTIKDRDVILVQHPAGFSLARATTDAGQDAMLDSFYNNRDYGVHELEVSLGSGSTVEHSLLQFELPAIAPGARIISAQLELYHYVTARSAGTPVVDLYRVTRGWVEGSHDGTGTADGATWNTWNGSNNWSSAGGDYAPAPVASSEISPATSDWESWEIGELLQGWIDGRYPNHGLLLKGTGDFDLSFASREDADPALHPKLSITYACACGEICVTPQGGGNLLMVVVSPTVLVAEDQQAKELFESWGYTVSVIGESANQATYDAQVAINDVVFISETVNSNSVGTKLQSAPIGVVSQDGDYNPDLGLATGASLKVGGEIDIVDTDHYITRPFTVGTHRIYTADMEQAIVSGSLTADQQTLAEIGGDGSLVVLEQGDAMEGGGTAVGRRAILPLGTRYRFDWDYLNANGRALVQRALEWGIGEDKPIIANLLLVVEDPATLLTQEAAKKVLFESWGYTVNLIGQNDSQASFASAVAANDVVFITEDIQSGIVNTKLTDAAIGVVTEEGNLTDEFGFSDGIHWGSGTALDIDNTHYITQPLASGNVTIFTTWESLADLTGTLAPDIDVIGNSTDGPAMATLDVGDSMILGGTAAGRRVILPWGGDNFDVNHLNADGLTILRRSLEWAAGAENPVFPAQLLFVVTDPGSLTADETAKKTLIESWGYTVNLIDDADSVIDFAAAFSANDVVYVSGEVSDGAIGSKLIKAPVGVVNEQIALHDELLLSTSAGSNDFNRIVVIDNTHYITEGIATGWHTIAASNQPLNALRGTLAPGMTNLAEVWISGANYDFGLAVVDTGGQLNGGEVAAGRRVQLPWGTASFDFSTLNANGQNLMQRAIEWAGGAEIDLSPIAHWKLDETSGPTAVDSAGGHDGTWTNGPVPVPGLVDGGLDFDGSNDYVAAGSFDVTGSGITMMGWFNAEAIATDDGRIISKANGPNEGDAWWQLSTTDSGANRHLRMRVKAGGTTTTFADSSVNLTTGQWYFAVGTYDSASGEMKLYLDGVEVASGAHAIGGAVDTDAAVPVAIGANGTAERFFNGILDDVQVYDYALGASQISDYYAANPPPGAASYTELYQPWSAASDDTWEVFDLTPFGVPGDAVVEVAVVNADAGKEQWGGVRAVGSSLERRFLLHEPESGGVDAVTMHVQADTSGQIQHYTSKKGTTSFVLLGYWTGASYIGLFEPFGANASNSWISEGVADEGLGPNQIAEVLMQNTNASAERLAGVRATGSSLLRRFDLHEAESGGVDAVTLMVATDAASTIEAYAENSGDVEFYVLGYWSTPPGTFTELGGTSARSTPSAAWGIKDVSSLGVPANSVAQFVITNDTTTAEKTVGVRAAGSSQDRLVDLQEAESGGSDLVTMHANVDANTEVEWYSESGTTGVFFYPLGAWALSP